MHPPCTLGHGGHSGGECTHPGTVAHNGWYNHGKAMVSV